MKHDDWEARYEETARPAAIARVMLCILLLALIGFFFLLHWLL